MKLTKEQVLKNLEDIVRFGGLTMSSEFVESVRMATEAYEQEPCEDCISRQAVIDITAETGALETQRRVMTLPPVQPKPKTGHWITPVRDDGTSDPICYQVRCSKCGFDLDPQTWHTELHQYGADKYCPNCGAKMESEDKE